MCHCNSTIRDMKVPPVPNQPKTFRFPQRTFGVKSFNPSWFDIRPMPDETRKGVEIVVRIVFPPALKKGMVRLLKKGTFSVRQHVKRALSARDDKQKGTFLSDLWHAGRVHLRTFIRFNTVVILLCNLLFSLSFFPQFPYFRILFCQRKLRKFLFPHFTLILT